VALGKCLSVLRLNLEKKLSTYGEGMKFVGACSNYFVRLSVRILQFNKKSNVLIR
jgi:hypothetical protein